MITSIKRNQQDQELIDYQQGPQESIDNRDLIQQLNSSIKINTSNWEKFLKYTTGFLQQVREHVSYDNERHKIIKQELKGCQNEKIIFERKYSISNQLLEFRKIVSYRKNESLVKREHKINQEEQIIERIVVDQNDNKVKQSIQKNTSLDDGTTVIFKKVINHLCGEQKITKYHLDNFIFVSEKRKKYINPSGKKLEAETIDTLLNEKVITKTTIHQEYKTTHKSIRSLGQNINISSKFENLPNGWVKETQKCQRFTQTILRMSYKDQKGIEIKEEQIGEQSTRTRFVKASYGPDYTQEITRNPYTLAVKNTYQNQNHGFQYIYNYEQYNNSKDKMISQSIKYRNGIQITKYQEILQCGMLTMKRLIYSDLFGKQKIQETYYANGNQIVETKIIENSGNDQKYQEFLDSTSFEKQLISLEQNKINSQMMKQVRKLAFEKQQIDSNKKNYLTQNYLPIIDFKDKDLYLNIEKLIQFWDQKYRIGYLQQFS